MTILFPVCFLTLAALPVQVKPLAGPAVTGELVEFTAETVVVQTAEGRQPLPLNALWELHARPAAPPTAPTPTVWVGFTDGTHLHAAQYTAAAGVAAVRLTSGAEVSVRTAQVHWVRLRDHTGQTELARQWQDIVAGKHTGDVLVVRRGSGLDELDGTLHDVTAEAVKFDFENDRLDVARLKLDGFVYHHPATNDGYERRWLVADASGSAWQAKSLAVVGDRLEVVTAAGVKASLPLTWLTKIDFSGSNAVWLSDLEPESVQWRPFFESKLPETQLAKMFHPRRDRSLGGQPLSVGGQVYAKGLALASRTELVYRLTDPYQQLHAVVGIDDNVRDRGNVQLVIAGDGKELLSKTVTGTDEPWPVNLDIRGVRRLKILVDFGAEQDVGDYLNLGDARLTK